MLSDLPTDLHLLILEHDEEKKHLKEENQMLWRRWKEDTQKISDLQDRVILLSKMLLEERGIPWNNNA
tara:strand:- start:992 stop:1195 length:204 start_codon:yes stop_codon:yes gene_type:complete